MSSRYESLTGAVDGAFPEYDRPPAEPMDLVRQWVAAATATGVREPLALALATAGRDGRISNRTVSIVEVSTAGLVFTTHDSSRKGREIAESGWAVRIALLAGDRPAAEPLRPGRAAARRRGRPAVGGPGGPAARDVHGLPAERPPRRRRRAAGRGRAAGGGRQPLPRPDRFAGYRLEPAAVEFWSAASDRLHRRLRYDRTPTGWHVARLQP